MNISSILNGISIGKDMSGNFKASIEGLAVRATPDGKFFVAKGNELRDVSELTFDGAESFVYRLPVQEADLKPGDLIITSETPFAALFVVSKHPNGRLTGLDPGTSQEVEFVSPTHVLFSLHLYVKVVSLLDGFGQGRVSEMLLPLLLAGDKGNGANANDTVAALLLSQAFGNRTPNNKLLPLLLLQGGSSGSLETLLLASAFGDGAGSLSKLFAEEAKPRKR